ncbi:MAG: type II secretion system F family protein [Coriobacteriales bacterium]|jgi:tight adherence protein B|nr:type II secretion system F family protein [Coriobacteriales bacterium]
MALVSFAFLMMAVVASALCGAAALPVMLTQLGRATRRSRIQTQLVDVGADEGHTGFLGELRRRGVAVLRPCARRLLRVSLVHRKCTCCAQALAARGQTTEIPVVCELLLLTFCVVTLVVFVLTGMFVTAICVAALVIGLVFGKAQKTLDEWETCLVEQIPDVLHSLGICFSAGYSLQQAFEQIARDTPDPLGSELRQASFDVCAGRSIEEALSALEKRTKAADLCFAIIALEIQHRTGGGLRELLESAADAVIASADLRRQLTVQTAQARLSAKVVTVLPLALVAVLSVAMEGYLQSFFSSAAGLAVLFIALGMECVGVLLIRRILGVDLG